MAKSGAIEDPDKLRSLLARVVLSPVFQFLMATALGTVIYFARAPAAYVSPYLFAEDWGWTSRVITRGFWDTALHARSDYVILGNVIVIWLGIQLANWCCGDVFSIPECIAVVSYVFFAATAALPLLLLRRQLPATWRWLAWLLVCVMPLGIHSWSGFEILGRSSNVGFVFVYIAFVLLWYRNTSVQTFWQALPVDLGLFVCTATNPICIAMLAAHLGGYRSTFPDRYFLGQNLVATLLVVVLAADVEKWLRGCPRFAWLPTAALLAFAAAAVIHEPLWKIAKSQFLIHADDAVRVTARKALRDRCFVNANLCCDPDVEFLEICVPCLRPVHPLYLPRRDVERSLEPIATRQRQGL